MSLRREMLSHKNLPPPPYVHGYGGLVDSYGRQVGTFEGSLAGWGGYHATSPPPFHPDDPFFSSRASGTGNGIAALLERAVHEGVENTRAPPRLGGVVASALACRSGSLCFYRPPNPPPSPPLPPFLLGREGRRGL